MPLLRTMLVSHLNMRRIDQLQTHTVTFALKAANEMSIDYGRYDRVSVMTDEKTSGEDFQSNSSGEILYTCSRCIHILSLSCTGMRIISHSYSENDSMLRIIQT